MIAPAELERWTQAPLEASGLDPAAAETVAVSLVHANRRAVDSHGVARLIVYSERLRAGHMNRNPVPKVEREDGAVALVDASGQTTTDPSDVFAAVPLGGYKGYALAVLVEVLSGVLSGSGVGHGIGRLYEDERPQDVGHGIPLPPTLRTSLEALSADLGVTVPAY